MSRSVLTFGVLIELLEDWLRNGVVESRIRVRMIDGKDALEIPVGGVYFVPNDRTIYLVARKPNEDDLFDDDGVLLNDESPEGIHRDLQALEKEGVDYVTAVGIEIWFDDGNGGDIQYRMEASSYSINKGLLYVENSEGSTGDEHEAEFRQLLRDQYKV